MSSKQDVQNQLNELCEQLCTSQNSSSEFTKNLEAQINTLTMQATVDWNEIFAVHTRNAKIVKQNTLAKQVSRVPRRFDKAVKELNSQYVKEHGVISDAMCTCIRDLVAGNVPVNNVSAIIWFVAEALNVNLVGDLSARSVGRVVKEGGVVAQLQLVDEIKLTKTMCLLYWHPNVATADNA
ncbi:hypothetical protein B0H10DRAFT_1949298 [Mycena sp. CBHHK59/15]|nr:hypothetical protein B0H10DRAFT_1949298 [Mycena sp. CBHHK59/15]